MNWLAHLRLGVPSAAGDDAAREWLGNLAGDFVRGVDLLALDPAVVRGVHLHRAVDRFVDAHPVVRRSRERLVGPLRRFGGVAVDVFYDHFLARDWATHGDGRALDAFVCDAHAALQRHREALPTPLAALVPRFVQSGWLEAYATVDGLGRVLGMMAQRRPRAQSLLAAADALRGDYDAFGDDFAALWPELCAFVAAQRGRT
ncbi:MAG: DUF479 domain-containing protein [Planctomycetes bacterium]|nr:DUF479 domain-containing protein [Planctomycetota bacterium]